MVERVELIELVDEIEHVDEMTKLSILVKNSRKVAGEYSGIAGKQSGQLVGQPLYSGQGRRVRGQQPQRYIS